MVAIMAVMSIATGAVVACAARHLPLRVERAETIAGVLFVGGLAVIGNAMPLFR